MLHNIKIVLVGTLYGGNIGSACRAMWNCGLSSLRLVAPSPDLDWSEAQKMAVHASGILNTHEKYPTLRDAVADCGAIVGTSALAGLYRQHARSPREVAADVMPIAAASNVPVAIVFGREDNGLDNDEVALCTHLVRIPTAPEQASLNLSQAVMVLAYELFLAHGVYERPGEKSPPAPGALRARMIDIWREYLLEIGFMDEQKSDHLSYAFNRIFSRGALTENDVTILMGVVRQSRWAIKNLHKQ